MLEDTLTEQVEWGLGPVVWLRPQFDSVSRVSSTHSEECVWIRVVQYELYIFGSSLVTIGVADRCGDAELSVGAILYEWWSRVSVALEPVDKVLVSAVDEGRWGWRPNALE